LDTSLLPDNVVEKNQEAVSEAQCKYLFLHEIDGQSGVSILWVRIHLISTVFILITSNNVKSFLMNFGYIMNKSDQSYHSKINMFKKKCQSYKCFFVFIDQIEGYFSQPDVTGSGCTIFKGR